MPSCWFCQNLNWTSHWNYFDTYNIGNIMFFKYKLKASSRLFLVSRIWFITLIKWTLCFVRECYLESSLQFLAPNQKKGTSKKQKSAAVFSHQAEHMEYKERLRELCKFCLEGRQVRELLSALYCWQQLLHLWLHAGSEQIFIEMLMTKGNKYNVKHMEILMIIEFISFYMVRA